MVITEWSQNHRFFLRGNNSFLIVLAIYTLSINLLKLVNGYLNHLKLVENRLLVIIILYRWKVNGNRNFLTQYNFSWIIIKIPVISETVLRLGKVMILKSWSYNDK